MAIAPSLEGKIAGDGIGDQDDDDGGDGNVDSTASGGDINLKRVKAALLAGDSQYMRQSQRNQTGNLPGSSWPPIRHPNRPNGHIRR